MTIKLLHRIVALALAATLAAGPALADFRFTIGDSQPASRTTTSCFTDQALMLQPLSARIPQTFTASAGAKVTFFKLGARWPELQPFYNFLEKKTNYVIGQALAPMLLESGALLLASYLISYYFGSFGLNWQTAQIIAAGRLVWHLKHGPSFLTWETGLISSINIIGWIVGILYFPHLGGWEFCLYIAGITLLFHFIVDWLSYPTEQTHFAVPGETAEEKPNESDDEPLIASGSNTERGRALAKYIRKTYGKMPFVDMILDSQIKQAFAGKSESPDLLGPHGGMIFRSGPRWIKMRTWKHDLKDVEPASFYVAHLAEQYLPEHPDKKQTVNAISYFLHEAMMDAYARYSAAVEEQKPHYIYLTWNIEKMEFHVYDDAPGVPDEDVSPPVLKMDSVLENTLLDKTITFNGAAIIENEKRIGNDFRINGKIPPTGLEKPKPLPPEIPLPATFLPSSKPRQRWRGNPRRHGGSRWRQGDPYGQAIRAGA